MSQPKKPIQVLLADPEAQRRGCLIRMLIRSAREADISLKITQWEGFRSASKNGTIKEVDLAIVSGALDTESQKPYRAIRKVLVYDDEAAQNAAANDDRHTLRVVHDGNQNANDAQTLVAFSEALAKVVDLRTKRRPRLPPELVVIGASTGGPEALGTILSKLHDLPFPILIVQHFPKGLSAHLAEGLNKKTSLAVQEATECDALLPGEAIVAQGGVHAHVVKRGEKYFVESYGEQPKDGCLPSIDIALSSLRTVLGTFAYVGLTGMGEDGKSGLAEVYDRTHVVTQSEESCVVYSMPRAVVQEGMSDQVLSLDHIAEMILKWARLAVLNQEKSAAQKARPDNEEHS
ncbi:MAG: chemotaxis protein CheB [Deltaproteobacteria bacterium]|nr:chemotaxis protein CheB [Deltaproteobacteria bacterium]